MKLKEINVETLENTKGDLLTKLSAIEEFKHKPYYLSVKRYAIAKWLSGTIKNKSKDLLIKYLINSYIPDSYSTWANIRRVCLFNGIKETFCANKYIKLGDDYHPIAEQGFHFEDIVEKLNKDESVEEALTLTKRQQAWVELYRAQ